jgi:hypothetical protein
MHPTQYLRRKGATHYRKSKYGYGSVRMLAKLACVGGGPIFRKAGKIISYTEADLNVCALSRISCPLAPTSEERAPRKTSSTHELKEAVL